MLFRSVMTGKINFSFKHAVSWVRNDFGKSRKVRFLDSVNSGTAVFPQASPNQHDELSFESWKDIEGEGRYFQWDFYHLEETLLEDEDEIALVQNRMMYTLTGEKEYLNKIYAIFGKRGGLAKHSVKRRKKTSFFKRPDRSANKKRISRSSDIVSL